MYCSYLVGYFLLQLTQTAFSLMSDEDAVLRIATRDGETKEPSCEELHRMWRHTKREIQQNLDMKPSPRYKGRYQEPISYGWKSPARPRNAMYSKPVYGRVVYSPDKFLYRNNVPHRLRSYDQVARMMGGSSNYDAGSNAQKQPATFFRLEYPNPGRRPMVPMRISHLGRFQELQNVLRNDRAREELQKTKQKQGGDGAETDSSDFPNDESESSKDDTYSQSNDDDTTAGNTNERKFRGPSGPDPAQDSTYSENTGSEARNESEDSQSTSKPVMTDDSIVHRWALGEWRR